MIHFLRRQEQENLLMYHIESQDKHPIDHWQTYFHQLFRHRSPFHQCLYHTNNSNNKNNNTKRTSKINIKKKEN